MAEWNDADLPTDQFGTDLAALVAIIDDITAVADALGGGTNFLTDANNLSDVLSAGTARGNLGLTIGSDVQAYSAVLSATTASFTSADETKLDGIEAGADVTDATNVAAAGALMDHSEGTEIKSTGEVGGNKFLREDGDGTCSWVTLTGGGDMVTSNNLSDLVNVVTARTNLGLGALAVAGTINDDDWSGADLDITNGGTGSSTASAARTALGLEIGVDVQAYSAVLAGTTASFTSADETKLDGIEAGADVTDTANVTAAGALMDSEVDADLKTLSLPANTTISAFGRTLIDDAAASNARTTLGLTIGSDVQGYSAVLAATTASFTTADESKLDGIESGADVTDTTNVTAAGALMDSEVDADIKTLTLPASTTISTFGASLVDDASASAARGTLGIDTDDSVTFADVTDSLGELRQLPSPDAAKTGSYSLDTGDVGCQVLVGTGGSITIPNSTFSADHLTTIINQTSGDITITCSIGTAYVAGADVATATLSAYGMCTIAFTSGTVCHITGDVS